MAILASKCKSSMTMTVGMLLGRTGRYVAGVFSVRLINAEGRLS